MWHQGRYADAGHYIAWVKTGIRERLTARGAPQPMWIKFDDEKVLDMRVLAMTCVVCTHMHMYILIQYIHVYQFMFVCVCVCV